MMTIANLVYISIRMSIITLKYKVKLYLFNKGPDDVISGEQSL